MGNKELTKWQKKLDTSHNYKGSLIKTTNYSGFFGK